MDNRRPPRSLGANGEKDRLQRLMWRLRDRRNTLAHILGFTEAFLAELQGYVELTNVSSSRCRPEFNSVDPSFLASRLSKLSKRYSRRAVFRGFNIFGVDWKTELQVSNIHNILSPEEEEVAEEDLDDDGALSDEDRGEVEVSSFPLLRNMPEGT